jgi:hypothetical protein
MLRKIKCLSSTDRVRLLIVVVGLLVIWLIAHPSKDEICTNIDSSEKIKSVIMPRSVFKNDTVSVPFNVIVPSDDLPQPADCCSLFVDNKPSDCFNFSKGRVSDVSYNLRVSVSHPVTVKVVIYGLVNGKRRILSIGERLIDLSKSETDSSSFKFRMVL